MKNVDNVAAGRLRAESLRWSRALVGLAAEMRERAERLRARLANGGDAAAEADARAFALGALGEPAAPASRAGLAAWLDRPLRVCGMVPNTGEPGGGPFWVRGADGRVTPPDRRVGAGGRALRRPGRDRSQARRTSTRCSSPARCGARTAAPTGSRAYVDPGAAMVARKSAGGRDLLALERPGLWNGAMAEWLTVFVEVPLAVFNPVKTVLDLLRPEHQPV